MVVSVFCVVVLGVLNSLNCCGVFRVWGVIVVVWFLLLCCFSLVSWCCVCVMVDFGRLVSVVICRLKLWLVGLFFIVCMNISVLLCLIVFRCMFVMLLVLFLCCLLVSVVSLK